MKSILIAKAKTVIKTVGELFATRNKLFEKSDFVEIRLKKIHSLLDSRDDYEKQDQEFSASCLKLIEKLGEDHEEAKILKTIVSNQVLIGRTFKRQVSDQIDALKRDIIHFECLKDARKITEANAVFMKQYGILE